MATSRNDRWAGVGLKSHLSSGMASTRPSTRVRVLSHVALVAVRKLVAGKLGGAGVWANAGLATRTASAATRTLLLNECVIIAPPVWVKVLCHVRTSPASVRYLGPRTHDSMTGAPPPAFGRTRGRLDADSLSADSCAHQGKRSPGGLADGIVAARQVRAHERSGATSALRRGGVRIGWHRDRGRGLAHAEADASRSPRGRRRQAIAPARA